MSRRDMLARLFRPVRAVASSLPKSDTPPVRPKGTVAATDPLQRTQPPAVTNLPPAGAAAPITPPAVQSAAPPDQEEESGIVGNLDLLAVISGRDCLAYQGEACSVCHDRCPVSGSIVIVDEVPHVEPAICVGCGVCHDVCPAPDNAIRVLARPPGLPRPASALIPPPGSSTNPPASPNSPFPSLEPRPHIEDV